MTTEPDEDLHKPDRLECEPSRVCGASANANQDNTVLEEISNIIKVHRQAFTQTKRSLPQFDGNSKEYYRFMHRSEESGMKQVDNPSSQPKFLIEMFSG